jgi:hypothetical protein
MFESDEERRYILAGGCPVCKNGVLVDDYWTCCGIFWALVLFPVGLICLVLCKKKRCTNCGTTYS